MKKTLLSLLLALNLAFCVNAQNVNIPDPNFKNFLVNHTYSSNPTGAGISIYLDSNHDGEIQYSEAETYPSNIYNHGFFIQGLNISDLTGIEAFDKIEELIIGDNPLTVLDISGCAALKRLNATSNNLFTTLNLVNSTLEEVTLSCPTLTSVDFSGCPALKIIRCSNNPIITSVNINGCVALREFESYQNPMLTTLTTGSHYYMTLFQVQYNGLTAIDVSGCRSLQYLFLTGNPLTSLNLANGNPQSFVQIIASGFPDLTCIKVNNVAVSEYLWTQTGGNYQFDEWANFSTDCNPTPPGPCLVTIPDANFKEKLVANSAINTNGNAEIECTEAEAYTGAINVDSSNISDMTGIQAFKNVTALSCNENSWEFVLLDVSGMRALTSISCNTNVQLAALNASACTALTTLDFRPWLPFSLNLNGCTALASLDVSDRRLTSLDVSNCSALISLVCNHNTLETLNLEGCTALTALNCSENQIASLTVSSNLFLTDVNCSFNELSSLNVLEHNRLMTLNCSNNQLTYLLVSNNTALTQLDCSENNISYLDVNNNLRLSNLNCSHNNLNTLNVSANVALTMFNCSNNNLSSQNVNANTELLSYNCSNNSISALNVSFNTALTGLYCDYNNLATVDLSNNSALKFLSCSYNRLPAIDLSGTPGLMHINCRNNQFTALDLSGVTHLTLLDCSDNQLANLDLSNTNFSILLCDNNQLQSLNVANGHNINAFVVTGANNPALSCVQVDDAGFSTENWVGLDFAFDSGVSFSEDCGALGVVAVSTPAFSVYPNPTNSTIHFSKQARIQVYSITGQVIADKQGVDAFDFSSQPRGFYLVTFRDDNGQVIQQSKIVKN